MPVKNRPTLLSLRPDLDRLAAECRRLGYLGCFVYVPPTTQQAAAARMFAPAIGVDQDIVNANSAGCLAAHLLATHRTTSYQAMRPFVRWSSRWAAALADAPSPTDEDVKRRTDAR